jgi:hypothetical protein
MNNNQIPFHVAIIPDGNRRWARKNGLPRFRGHEIGLGHQNTNGKIFSKVLPFVHDGGPFGTVPELLFEKKQLIPALQQLIVTNQ